MLQPAQLCMSCNMLHTRWIALSAPTRPPFTLWMVRTILPFMCSVLLWCAMHASRDASQSSPCVSACCMLSAPTRPHVLGCSAYVAVLHQSWVTVPACLVLVCKPHSSSCRENASQPGACRGVGDRLPAMEGLCPCYQSQGESSSSCCAAACAKTCTGSQWQGLWCLHCIDVSSQDSSLHSQRWPTIGKQEGTA